MRKNSVCALEKKGDENRISSWKTIRATEGKGRERGTKKRGGTKRRKID